MVELLGTIQRQVNASQYCDSMVFASLKFLISKLPHRVVTP